VNEVGGEGVAVAAEGGESLVDGVENLVVYFGVLLEDFLDGKVDDGPELFLER
jgi:hypothetical protein